MYTDANLRGHNAMIPGDYALEQKLADAKCPEEIRELTKQWAAASGTIIRTRDEDYFQVLKPQTAAAATAVALPAAPAAEEHCIRVVYPSGNMRVELYGVDEASLDAKEAAIRQMFGGQR